MTKKTIQAGLFILVISSLLLTACGGASPTTAPTVDANQIYTQAAQTVAASSEKTKAVQPPATNTPKPSATSEAAKPVDPDVAAAMTATANAITNPNTNANTTPAAGATKTTPAVVIPTATGTKPVVVNKPPSTTADKCQWISNYPTDGSDITKNASFDASVKVKNTGTTTWTKQYALRYFAGERMGAPDTYVIQHDVKPNETYTWVFTLKAPDATGTKELWLVVQNPDGQNMCMINMPMDFVP